jgi:predicted lipoprotein with Yx(FWY)xxD motif
MHLPIARRRRLLALAPAAAALALSIAAVQDHGAAAASKRVVGTSKNRTLGETVLVTTSGSTLYSLSVERKGRFICTSSACLALWRPLLVPRGTTPTGVSGLATIARPGSHASVQVTFHGAPLYRFTADRKRGDAKGEGFRDVGTWHAASTAPAARMPAPSSGAGGGYYG